MILYSQPSFGSEEEQAVKRVLAPDFTFRSEIEAFEQEFATYVGVKHAIFTNSCTSALKLGYKYAREIKKKKGILCRNNTYCATYAAAVEMGLDYILFDKQFLAGWSGVHVSHGTEIIDAQNKILRDGYIDVVMHYGGTKAEHLDPGNPYNFIIEDSAHRIEPNDPLVGKIRCYSFHEQKNMACGRGSSGGMFATNDQDIYDWARLQWNDGRVYPVPGGLYAIKTMAGGYEGTDMAATIGREQLKKLPAFNTRREAIRDAYNQAFKQDWQGTHLYPYFVKTKAQLAPLQAKLKEAGIATSYHYPTAEGDYRDDWLGISLPLYPLLSDAEVETVVKHVKDLDN